MRKVGDILFVKFGNEHDGKKCKITGVNKINGDTKFDIELLDLQFNWKTGQNDLKLEYLNVHYCHLKEHLN